MATQYMIKFNSVTHERLGLDKLQEKVGDSVITNGKREYIITEEQRGRLDDNAIKYSKIRVMHDKKV